MCSLEFFSCHTRSIAKKEFSGISSILKSILKLGAEAHPTRTKIYYSIIAKVASTFFSAGEINILFQN